MVSTYTSYKLYTNDIQKSLDRIEKQPQVARETEYYMENIGKITSVEEFVDDTRLFRYAMKAHGLEDMAYAKAFMKKVLEGGISDKDSFANKLTDKKYFEFAKTYNFDAYGAGAMTYRPAVEGTAGRYQLQALQAGVDIADPLLAAQTAYFKANIVKATSVDAFMADDNLYAYAMKAYGLTDSIGDRAFMKQILEGGVSDPNSLANKQTDKAFAQFAAAFDFAAHGTEATSYSPAQHGTVDRYVRQQMEETAGAQNDGVRLALYFQRVAPSVSSVYQILGDPALSQVVRTILGLPSATANADIDIQAKMITSRMDIADLKDPEKLDKLMARFTTMYELQNGTAASSSPALMLLSQPIENGISTDLMMRLQSLKF